jgi:hypothetical protein
MFNLEQAITDWRQQMLAAGIHPPARLEELNQTLRASIGSLRLLGIPEDQAFDIAKSRLERTSLSGLEQAIGDWRGQMLAAGIRTPIPLEELELHLREEIAQQTKSGLGEPEAFNSAVQRLGQPHLVQQEFSKLGFWGVPIPAGCKVLGAKFEVVLVCAFTIFCILHLGLCLRDDGLNFLRVEGSRLANLIALDLLVAFVLAKMFCRVTALGVSADGFSVSSAWWMRHFVGWREIKQACVIRRFKMCSFRIVTRSGRKFTWFVFSKSQEQELIMEICRRASEIKLEIVTCKQV